MPKAPRIPQAEWERHKFTMHDLYYFERGNSQSRGTVEKLRREMSSKWNFIATESQYRTQFRKWGFDKNNRNAEQRWKYVNRKLQERSGRPSEVVLAGEVLPESTVIKETYRYAYNLRSESIPSSPSSGMIVVRTPRALSSPKALGTADDLDCVVSAAPCLQQGSLFNSAQNFPTDAAPRMTPPILPAPLPVIETWRVSEKLLYDTNVFVKGSFEAGLWRVERDASVIFTSPTMDTQISDQTTLCNFLTILSHGCAAAKARDFVLAGNYWREAFIGIETLVQSQFYNIIPKLIGTIIDLKYQGLTELADKSKQHTAMCGKALLAPGRSELSLYCGLGELDMDFLEEIEEKMLKRFSELFELYGGPFCYDRLVIMMDRADRTLLQDPWMRIEDGFPAISLMYYFHEELNHPVLDDLNHCLSILRVQGLQTKDKLEVVTLILQRAERVLTGFDPIRRLSQEQVHDWARSVFLEGARYGY